MKTIEKKRIVKHLESMSGCVRKFLNGKGHDMVEVLFANPKEGEADVTRRFDYRAEEIAINYCRKNFRFPVRILTEERGAVITKRGEPFFTLVIDPVDGSTNYKRNIESTAFSVALIPKNQKIIPKNVEIALVSYIWSGNLIYAMKGEGAYYKTADGKIKPARGSSIRDIRKALLGMDLDFNADSRWKWQRVMKVIQDCHMIRRGGSAAQDAAYVAIGAYDAIIDVRDKSTPENFMAAYLLIKEAGGLLTGPDGKELGEMEDIKRCYNWVASGNRELHKQIIERIRMDAKPGTNMICW